MAYKRDQAPEGMRVKLRRRFPRGLVPKQARSQAVLGNAVPQAPLAVRTLEAGASTPGSQAQLGNQRLDAHARWDSRALHQCEGGIKTLKSTALGL